MNSTETKRFGDRIKELGNRFIHKSDTPPITDFDFDSIISERLYQESQTIAEAIGLFDTVDTEHRFQDDDKKIIYEAMCRSIFQCLREASKSKAANIPTSLFSTFEELRADFGSEWKPSLTTSTDEITRQRALYYIGSGSVLATRHALIQEGERRNISNIDILWFQNIHDQVEKGEQRMGWYFVNKNIRLPQLTHTENLHRDYQQFINASPSHVVSPQ